MEGMKKNGLELMHFYRIGGWSETVIITDGQ